MLINDTFDDKHCPFQSALMLSMSEIFERRITSHTLLIAFHWFLHDFTLFVIHICIKIGPFHFFQHHLATFTFIQFVIMTFDGYEFRLYPADLCVEGVHDFIWRYDNPHGQHLQMRKTSPQYPHLILVKIITSHIIVINHDQVIHLKREKTGKKENYNGAHHHYYLPEMSRYHNLKYNLKWKDNRLKCTNMVKVIFFIWETTFAWNKNMKVRICMKYYSKTWLLIKLAQPTVHLFVGRKKNCIIQGDFI